MKNMLRVREIFLTLQGEGRHSGSRAVFVRLAGCNLWTGRDEDRNKGKGACSKWCDTDFFRGDWLSVDDVLEQMALAWGGVPDPRCVITGGEPLLQLMGTSPHPLLARLASKGWHVAVETNGTRPVPPRKFDWVCVAPKMGATLSSDALRAANEIKVVLPGAIDRDWTEDELLAIQAQVPRDTLLYVQPLDAAGVDARSLMVNVDPVGRCLQWVHAHPEWRLSLQTHKLLGLP